MRRVVGENALPTLFQGPSEPVMIDTSLKAVGLVRMSTASTIPDALQDDSKEPTRSRGHFTSLHSRGEARGRQARQGKGVGSVFVG